jgi:hypothetical protein
MNLNYKSLKARHREERGGYHINLSLRVHRSLSWLDHAERSSADKDAQFISLWIAFNAAYAREFDLNSDLTEHKVFSEFIERLCGLDKAGMLDAIVWTEFAGSIRVLLDNKFVYRPFWGFCEGKVSESDWQDKFAKDKKIVSKALRYKNTALILNIIFSRLYTLRNQILHGGSTWNSRVNRSQLRDGVAILAKVIPSIISIMMDNPGELWGDPCYPVVES